MGKINVLWTGGLDSTYRMAELSRYSVEVQAYYVVDPIRKSVPQERKAMKTILALLRKNPNTIAKYNDIIEIDRDSIPANEDITASWKVFRDEYRVGSQYDFLARYAKKHNLRMEVSLDGGGTNGHMGRATQAVLEKGDLQIVSTAGGDVLRINPLTTSIDTRNLFENIDIPTFVWYHDKQGEWQALHEMGLSEVAKATWFCHNPIFGLPCGHCNPCKDVKEAGMEYRLSLKGKLLYNILKPYFWIIAHF